MGRTWSQVARFGAWVRGVGSGRRVVAEDIGRAVRCAARAATITPLSTHAAYGLGRIPAEHGTA